jgi:hypothetical protein
MRVDCAHHHQATLVVGADHDAIGPHEIPTAAPRAEFGIRHDGKRRIGAARSAARSPLRERSAVPTGTVDFVDDDRVFRHPAADGARGCGTYFMSADPSSSGGVPTAMNCKAPHGRGV